LNESAVAVHVTSRITVVSDRQVRGIKCPEYCALTEDTRLAIKRKQVLVDPETQRHVWVHDEIKNCTTANMCVLVDVAFGVCNLNDCTHWIDNHTLDTVGSTARNVDEHVDGNKQLNV
jgi:hypothetical protein